MIKRILIILVCSVAFTIIIVATLLWTKSLFLDRLVHFAMKIRGTTTYEGEEKATEVWNIIVGMVIPILFLLSIALVAFFSRNKFKSR